MVLPSLTQPKLMAWLGCCSGCGARLQYSTVFFNNPFSTSTSDQEFHTAEERRGYKKSREGTFINIYDNARMLYRRKADRLHEVELGSKKRQWEQKVSIVVLRTEKRDDVVVDGVIGDAKKE
ncbi:hypothetical protein FB446DRAFT_709830 [Lentinula raphanica]|nr:hypothetical protein FB446DRAFT_709830 [Lentinula raphanica]